MAKGKPFPFPAKGGPKSKPVDKPTEIGKGNPFAKKAPMPFSKGGRAK